MKINTATARTFSPSTPNTFVNQNPTIPRDRDDEDDQDNQGRRVRFRAALVVTPVLTSVRLTPPPPHGVLTHDNVDELSELMERLALNSPTAESDGETLGRVQSTAFDSKRQQYRTVLRSARIGSS